MVDLVTYEFKDSNVRKITPEYLFINACKEDVHESEQVRTTTKNYVYLYMLNAKRKI